MKRLKESAKHINQLRLPPSSATPARKKHGKRTRSGFKDPHPTNSIEEMYAHIGCYSLNAFWLWTDWIIADEEPKRNTISYGFQNSSQSNHFGAKHPLNRYDTVAFDISICISTFSRVDSVPLPNYLFGRWLIFFFFFLPVLWWTATSRTPTFHGAI